MSVTNEGSAAANDGDWFENVENFRPLRGGRRAGTLNEVVSQGPKVTVEEAERKFIEQFDTAATGLSDPLDSMCSFFGWFEEHFPSGKQKYIYPMLYKVCTTLSVQTKYKNDERLLKLWMKLCENFPESGLAVMEFAFAKGSCRQLAKFYIHWSEMYQTIKWWNKAREKLKLGQDNCAMPLNLLHRASDELESRAMAISSGTNENDDWEQEQIGDSISRITLGKLRGLGRKHIAPIVRAPQGPPGMLAAPHQKSRAKEGFSVFSDETTTSAREDPTPLDLFQTPIARPGKKKSRIAESLQTDMDYQTLFGNYVELERVDLQITNEENEFKSNCKLQTSKVEISEQTDSFEIYQESSERKERDCKAKLKLKKEYVNSMSIEEGYAKFISTTKMAQSRQ